LVRLLKKTLRSVTEEGGAPHREKKGKRGSQNEKKMVFLNELLGHCEGERRVEALARPLLAHVAGGDNRRDEPRWAWGRGGTGRRVSLRSRFHAGQEKEEEQGNICN